MDKRGRLARAGLLDFLSPPIFLMSVLLILFPGVILFSQQDGAGDGEFLEFRIETVPAIPTVNSAWSLFVLVNHPNPQEVRVISPQFPPSLSLEMTRTGSRFIDGERWTSVEYSFIPVTAGEAVLQPFAVTALGRQAATSAVSVSIQPFAGSLRFSPSLRWLEPVAAVPSGQRGELFLELSDWDPHRDVPAGIFQGRAPRNAILNEGIPRAAAEGVYLYSISIIPLEESSITLEPFSFQAASFFLHVPEITVLVLPPLPPPPILAPEDPLGEALPGAALPDDAQARADAAIPFPKTREKFLFLLQDEYGRIVAETRARWEESRRAHALAEIRRSERNSLAGPFLASLRRDMERSLGLVFTQDESWSPLGIPLFAWAAFAAIFIAGILLFIFRPRLGLRKSHRSGSVTSHRRGGFQNVIIVVFFIGLALIVLEVGWGRVSIGRLASAGRTAVLEKTPAFRVPDSQGAVNAWFDEGQPVILRSCDVYWCYVESVDGRSGWVPRWAVISY